MKKLLYEDRGHTLSRSVEAENTVKKDVAGKPKRKMRKDESYFKYEVDVHYHYSAREVVFDTDLAFMDKVGDFYKSALKGEL